MLRDTITDFGSAGGVSHLNAKEKLPPNKKEILMVEAPQKDYESFDSTEDMFESFEEEQKEEDKRHPVKANIRDWLDKIFPSGIADTRAYYALAHPWKILRYYKDEIKYAYQRVSKGYDDKATWHVGYYLAETLPKIIRQLKEEGHGVPISMYTEESLFALSEKRLGSIDKDGNYIETDEDKAASEKWDKILDEIAEGFECYLKYDEKFGYKTPREEDENYQKFQKALVLLKEYYEDLWD
jgi:hypothetical protein